MDFNVDRLGILSGVIDRDEYTNSLLTEDKKRARALNEMEATVVLTPQTPEELDAVDAMALDPDQVEVEPSPEATVAASAAGGADEDVADLDPVDDVAAAAEEVPPPPAEEMPPAEAMEEELEERLRIAIRHEVQSVLAEVMAQKEEEDLERGRKMKSVGVSMGFAGVGFEKPSPRRSNRAHARGPGGVVGFGGPGFK